MTVSAKAGLPTDRFVGVYTPQDAAKYIAVTTPPEAGLSADDRTIARWVRKGVADAGYKGGATRYVFIDFDGLISMRMISMLRAAGLSWPVIRRAEQWLKEHTGTSKPFASAALWQGSGEIFSELDAQLVTPSRHGQGAFHILREYIVPVGRLRYQDEWDMPLWWEPMEHVRLNPRVQFGSPCIAGTRVPTDVIYGSIAAGDAKESIPEDYGITMDQVEAAIDWESRLRAD